MDQRVPEVYVFPLDTPNQKIMDLKQLLASEASIRALDQQIAENEYKNGGWEQELRSRRAECVSIINKIREKYRTVE